MENNHLKNNSSDGFTWGEVIIAIIFSITIVISYYGISSIMNVLKVISFIFLSCIGLLLFFWLADAILVQLPSWIHNIWFNLPRFSITLILTLSEKSIVTIDWGDGKVKKIEPKQIKNKDLNNTQNYFNIKCRRYFFLPVNPIRIKGNIEELTCINHNRISISLDISECTTLKRLFCHRNYLSTLDVSKNTALTELWCSNNQLTTLDVSKNTALTELSCGGNQLTTLDVSKNTALTELSCGGNQLTALDVSKNTALKKLGCGGNQLTSLDVNKNTALTELWCGGNQLTSLDVNKNTALKKLGCGGNQLTSLDVNKNTALTELWCGGNQFTAQAMNAIYNALPIVHGYLECDKLGNWSIAEEKGWKVVLRDNY